MEILKDVFHVNKQEAEWMDNEKLKDSFGIIERRNLNDAFRDGFDWEFVKMGVVVMVIQ